MKLHYYPETDSLYIELIDRPGAETREIADGLNVDLDADGAVAGFDIDGASKKARSHNHRDHRLADQSDAGRLSPLSPEG